MLHKISLLDELRKGGYEASLITTFNAYLPFYEEVVLRRLVNAGIRHNVLMMDAGQYAHSVAAHPPLLAGRSYTLMPLQVAGAFHPKLIFLAGKNKGLFFIGSHNLTLSGFGFNRELTNLIRVEGAEDSEGIILVRTLWAEIEHWLDQFCIGVPEPVARMVRRVRDFAPWLADVGGSPGDIRLLAGRPGARPLWEQFTDLLHSEAEQVSLGGAFFDQNLRFLQRLKQDLVTDNCTIAIDPTTVQLPRDARTFSGVSLVRADQLGVEDDKESDGNRYLHAKGILVQQKDGSAVFASGSANPSAPAWLASETTGNVELMIAYLGDRARTAAEEVGYASIANMPPLSEGDWDVIGYANQDAEVQPSLFRTGLAVVEDDHVAIDASFLDGRQNATFALYGQGATESATSSTVRLEGGDTVLVAFAPADLASASVLHVLMEGKLAAKLLLHHAQVIEEHARSGTQRRFKEALLSLETDTPNIELLVSCVDKIVFSESRAPASNSPKQAGVRNSPAEIDEGAPTTLAIDVSEVKRSKAKTRLTHSGDFAYLLDALIYHLRMQQDKSIEEIDQFGRSEEEQVGTDDDPDADDEANRDQKHEMLLDVCHARVATVINRIISQLKAYAAAEQTLDNVLVRLLAVLAVLRELRGCDGRVPWVGKGKTTVPMKHRLRLLDEIMFTLFEGSSSLLHLDAFGEEFQQSDDVARLKGLVLWLAWDCGLAMDLRKPFMESAEDRKKRLHANAMVLALAQMIKLDEVVIDEARQSIGSLTSSEMGWLKEIQRISQRCASIRGDSSGLRPATRCEPGDIAVHRTMDDWNLRIVESNGGKRVYLMALSRDKDRLAFASEHLAVAPLI